MLENTKKLGVRATICMEEMRVVSSAKKNPCAKAFIPAPFLKGSGAFGSLFKKLVFPTILKDLRLWENPAIYLFCFCHSLFIEECIMLTFSLLNLFILCDTYFTVQKGPA